jgi:hypothetical protein
MANDRKKSLLLRGHHEFRSVRRETPTVRRLPEKDVGIPRDPLHSPHDRQGNELERSAPGGNFRLSVSCSGAEGPREIRRFLRACSISGLYACAGSKRASLRRTRVAGTRRAPRTQAGRPRRRLNTQLMRASALVPEFSGKHVHLNHGLGLLTNLGPPNAYYETGWTSDFDPYVHVTDADLQCPVYGPTTWTLWRLSLRAVAVNRLQGIASPSCAAPSGGATDQTSGTRSASAQQGHCHEQRQRPTGRRPCRHRARTTTARVRRA